MASSASEVPYNHATENVLFGQNVVEKITDTCLGQDGKRYYQVKWRDSWEPEERLMSACESVLQAFWKDYYANVEQEIRKQVVSASKGIGGSLPAASVSSVVESFPEQSSTVAYYAVQGNDVSAAAEEESQNAPPPMQDIQLVNDGKADAKELLSAGEQADILTEIISSVTGASVASAATAKWSDNKSSGSGRKAHCSVTADTLNTKTVTGPDQNAKFHCDICLRTFVSKRNVQRHMLSHTGEKPWMCEFCFKRFRQKPHLEQHVNIHRGIKNAVCSVCGKAFNHRSNLVTHMATHSNIRPHVCEVCGESFKLKHTLQKHVMVHTKQDPEKRHQCKICKRSFRDRSYLTEHEMIHKKDKPWQCDICLKSFSFKRRYQIHMELHQSTASPGDEGLYLCHLCPKKFKGKIYLQRHLDKHESRRIRTKKKKRRKMASAGDASAANQMLLLSEIDNDNHVEEDEEDGDDDDDGSIKHEDLALLEGEATLALKNDAGEPEPGEEVKIVSVDGREIRVQIHGSGADNLMVAGMLPMTSLHMEDATYVALAQLTQAAIESAPLDASGNVILMSYEDIQRSMENLHAGHSEHLLSGQANLQDLRVAPQHAPDSDQVSLDAILKVAAEQQRRQGQQHVPAVVNLDDAINLVQAASNSVASSQVSAVPLTVHSSGPFGL